MPTKGIQTHRLLEVPLLIRQMRSRSPKLSVQKWEISSQEVTFMSLSAGTHFLRLLSSRKDSRWLPGRSTQALWQATEALPGKAEGPAVTQFLKLLLIQLRHPLLWRLVTTNQPPSPPLEQTPDSSSRWRSRCPSSNSPSPDSQCEKYYE